ncbi:MAG: DUF5611 family protein [Methanosarcinales archaeon]
MKEYTFKRGFKPDKERIFKALGECFPCNIEQHNNKYILSYGALKKMEVILESKKLSVSTETDLSVSDEVIRDTNKRFRSFLQLATGYTSKERYKKLQKM